MKRQKMSEIERFDNLISLCCGAPQGSELPQVATADEIIMEMMCDLTGKPLDEIDVLFHHQTDPSYH